METPATSDVNQHKRQRSPNFTEKEVNLLLKLVAEHVDIIECKKTDLETSKVKNMVWKNICELFNDSSGTEKRKILTLRQKYEGLKKITRKKYFKNREESQKQIPNFVAYEDYEKKLLNILERLGGISSDQFGDSNNIPEYEFSINTNNIKAEDNSTKQLDLELSSKDGDSFVITDEDLLWDLPSDNVNRPRCQLVKKQLEYLEQEERRKLAEHTYKMKNEELKRKFMLAKERRARIEHKKKMELLEFEIELKKKSLDLGCNNNS